MTVPLLIGGLVLLVIFFAYNWAKSERLGGADNAAKKALQKAFRIKAKAEEIRAEPLDSGPDLLDDWGDVRDDSNS